MANIGIMLAAALASLAGSEWGPESDGKPDRYIQFRENDVAGHGGCNRFAGRYTFDGSSIKIGPLVSTKMACELEVMAAEQAWLGMLERVRKAEATPKTLVLKDQNNNTIATLRRKDWD